MLWQMTTVMALSLYVVLATAFGFTHHHDSEDHTVHGHSSHCVACVWQLSATAEVPSVSELPSAPIKYGRSSVVTTSSLPAEVDPSAPARAPPVTA
jgi:hypothetical protein